MGPQADEPDDGELVDEHRSSAQHAAPAWTHALAAEPEEEALPEPGEEERWDDEATVAADDAGPETAMAVSVAPAAEPAALTVSAPAAEPVAPPKPTRAPRPAAKPRTRAAARTPGRSEPAAVEQVAPPTEPASASEPSPPSWPAPIDEPAPTSPQADVPKWPEPESLAPPPAAPADVPSLWPPAGDQGVRVEPYARVPAGSYLPPSAVLPSGEAPASAAPNDRPSLDPAASPGPNEASAASPRPAAPDRLAQLGLPADTPRRVVGIGAVVASLGFLLPWAPVLAGSGLLGGYWTQWGLAGPGHWIVAVLLVALALLSLAGGRPADVPVGLPAVAIATLLAGLSWPYLFGFLGRAVGIWVVLFGAILLVSGGLLDLRADRHGDPDSTV
jgi:hypothetical protein